MADPGGAGRVGGGADLVSALPDMYFRVGADEVFLEFQGGRHDLALPPEQFLGRRVRDVMPPAVAGALLDAAARARQTGELQRVEYELPLRGGRQVFEDRVVATAQGDTVHVVRNVTERRLAEESLHEATDLLHAIASVQGEFIAGDPHGVYERMLGLAIQLTRSELGFAGEVVTGPEGAPLLRVHAVTDLAWSEPTRSWLRERAAAGVDFTNLRTLFGAVVTTGATVIANDAASDPRRGGLPPGHPEIGSFLGVPLTAGERLVGAVCLANRIGGYQAPLVDRLGPFFAACASLVEARRAEERRRREAQERAALEKRLAQADRLGSLGTLAAGVAHEINNPLTYVRANLELLGEVLAGLALPPEVAAEVGDALADARTGADRIRHVVQGLQAFVTPRDAGGGPVALPDVVDRAAALVMNELRHRARFEREDAASPPVRGEAGRLVQLVVNLLMNAIQAIPAGQGDAHAIRVTTRAEAGLAVLEVRDTGRGMPPEVLPRVFDPFFTTRDPGAGSGLGLPVCHAIASAHGGDIELESEPGRGTLVRVKLPAAPPEPGEAPAPEPAGGAGRRRRVLVVDDEPLVLATVARLLQPEVEIDGLADAREALSRLEGGARYDAALCDLMMPGLTGMAFHDALAARWPELAARCGFVTGGAFTDEARRFVERWPGRTLEKPFEAGALRALVRRLADG
ncbi:MAG TPA: ATP-binding protein [Anaeromyxobacteraceae bacterium]|nr:ATP-binding protein [Anaeromyxobacteraceae bacterium]